MADQPMRIPSGGAYGDRQRLEQLQRSAPMAAADPVPQMRPAPQAALVDPFAPTQRPEEPITAGIPHGPGPNGLGGFPKDHDLPLRAAYRAAVDNGWPGAEDLAEMLQQVGR